MRGVMDGRKIKSDSRIFYKYFGCVWISTKKPDSVMKTRKIFKDFKKYLLF